MERHHHDPGQYCDDCRPALDADYGVGEQFWRHWSTPGIKLPTGIVARYKILSKKTEGGFQFVCLLERQDGLKGIFAEGKSPTDDQLRAMVQGIGIALAHLYGMPDLKLEMTDFTSCDTLEKWEYMLREGTTFGVWNLKGDEANG